MKKLLFLLVILAFFACNEAENKKKSPVNLASGWVERIDSFPSKFVSPRNVDVWLPDNYDSEMEYAVLYMHDGQMLFDSTTTWNKQEWGIDETVGKLLKKNKIHECIVVGIWNSDKERHADYFPQKPFEKLDSAFRDSLISKAKRNPETALFATNVQSDNYLKFIVEELKPFIDSAYSTHKSAKNTFIAGSSMGGLISMYALCEYPNVFGGAACMSTHWTGIFEVENNPIPQKFIEYLSENLPDPATHKIYFDFGTETLDALYEPFQIQADSVMKAKGYDNKNWITKKFEGKDHSEKAWRERIDIPLIFLLGN